MHANVFSAQTKIDPWTLEVQVVPIGLLFLFSYSGLRQKNQNKQTTSMAVLYHDQWLQSSLGSYLTPRNPKWWNYIDEFGVFYMWYLMSSNYNHTVCMCIYILYIVSINVWMSPVYVFSRSIWLASVRVGRHWPPCCWHKVTPSVGPPRWTQKWNAAGRWLVTQFTTCRKACHGPGTVRNTCPHSKTDLNATKGVIDIRRSSTIWIIFLVYKSLIFDINILFIWIERIASVCLRKGYQSYDIVFRHQHAHVYGYGHPMDCCCKAVGIFGGNQRLLHALQGRGAFVWSLSWWNEPGGQEWCNFQDGISETKWKAKESQNQQQHCILERC